MIREAFPEAGSRYSDGHSDGRQYQIVFTGTNLNQSLEMIRSFLEEEGYGEIPLPANGAELLHFRLPTRRDQIMLFADNGYVHNPVKILFNPAQAKPKTLTLCIFNEKTENHLLKFHGKLPEV